jgi:hypothetical protein
LTAEPRSLREHKSSDSDCFHVKPAPKPFDFNSLRDLDFDVEDEVQNVAERLAICDTGMAQPVGIVNDVLAAELDANDGQIVPLVRTAELKPKAPKHADFNLEKSWSELPKSGAMSCSAIYATNTNPGAAIAPSAREYRESNQIRKDSKKKGAKGKKAKAKAKGRPKKKPKAKGRPKMKPRSAAPAASSEIVQERRHGVLESDPLYRYLDWNCTEPAKQVMVERVRSKGWHQEYDKRIAAGFDKETSKDKAKIVGREFVARWLTFFP